MTRPRKPTGMTSKHWTDEERAQREAAEDAVRPSSLLRKKHPQELEGNERAISTWNKLRRLYDQTAVTLATSFDEGLLIDYCKGVAELDELQEMRSQIRKEWKVMLKKAQKLAPGADDFGKTWDIVNALSAKAISFDARLDAKRKLLHTLRQKSISDPTRPSWGSSGSKTAERGAGRNGKAPKR